MSTGLDADAVRAALTTSGKQQALYSPTRQNRRHPAVLKHLVRAPSVTPAISIVAEKSRSPRPVGESVTSTAANGTCESLTSATVLPTPEESKRTWTAKVSAANQLLQPPPPQASERLASRYSSAGVSCSGGKSAGGGVVEKSGGLSSLHNRSVKASATSVGHLASYDDTAAVSAVARVPSPRSGASKMLSHNCGDAMSRRRSSVVSDVRKSMAVARSVATIRLVSDSSHLLQPQLPSTIRESPLYGTQEASERLAAQLLPLELQQRTNRCSNCDGGEGALHHQSNRAASSCSSFQPSAQSSGSPPRPRRGNHPKSRHRQQQRGDISATTTSTGCRSFSIDLTGSSLTRRSQRPQPSRGAGVRRTATTPIEPRFPKPPEPQTRPGAQEPCHPSSPNKTKILPRGCCPKGRSRAKQETPLICTECRRAINDRAIASTHTGDDDQSSCSSSLVESTSTTTASCGDRDDGEEETSCSSETESRRLCGSAEERVGPVAFPEFLQARNPRFADSGPSPYCYFYYDETAPNEVLLANDVKSLRPCRLAKHYLEDVIKCKKGKSQLYEVTGARYDPNGREPVAAVGVNPIDDGASDADSQVLRRVSKRERHLSIISHGSSVFTASAFTSLAPFEMHDESEQRGGGWLGCCGGGKRRGKATSARSMPPSKDDYPTTTISTAGVRSPEPMVGQVSLPVSETHQIGTGSSPHQPAGASPPRVQLAGLPGPEVSSASPTLSAFSTRTPDPSSRIAVQFHTSPLAQSPAPDRDIEASHAWMGGDKSKDLAPAKGTRKRRTVVVSKFSVLPGQMAYQPVTTIIPTNGVHPAGNPKLPARDAWRSELSRPICRSPLADLVNPDIPLPRQFAIPPKNDHPNQIRAPSETPRACQNYLRHARRSTFHNNNTFAAWRRQTCSTCSSSTTSSPFNSQEDDDEEEEQSRCSLNAMRNVRPTARGRRRRLSGNRYSSDSGSSCHCTCCRVGRCRNETKAAQKSGGGAVRQRAARASSVAVCSIPPSESISHMASRLNQHTGDVAPHRVTAVSPQQPNNQSLMEVASKDGRGIHGNRTAELETESVYYYARPKKPERQRNFTYRVWQRYFDGDFSGVPPIPGDSSQKLLPQYSVSYRQYPAVYFDVIEPQNNREFFRVRNAPGFYG